MVIVLMRYVQKLEENMNKRSALSFYWLDITHRKIPDMFWDTIVRWNLTPNTLLVKKKENSNTQC